MRVAVATDELTSSRQVVVSRPDWAVALLAGATMFALFDIARIVFPSIAFIYGRAGSTPAGQMGLFALLLFGTAGLVARAAGVNPRLATPALTAAVILARIFLIAAPGGRPQLLASSVGLAAVVGLFGALAASDIELRAAAQGIALGVLASLTVHVMLATHDSIWLQDGIGWLVTLALSVTLIVGLYRVQPSSERPRVRSTIPWLLIGPVLSLQGIAASTPGALRLASGEAEVWPGTLLVATSAVGFLAGRFVTSSFAREFSGTLALVPAVLTAVLLAGNAQPGIAAMAAVLATFLCTFTLTLTGEATDDALATAGRRSAAPAFGMIMAFVVVFGYYASYELKIGFPRGLLPAASAVLMGLVLFRLTTVEDEPTRPRLEDVGTVAFLPFVVAFVLLAGQGRVLPVPFDASLERVRVMTWNVAMGYDIDGTFVPEDIVDEVRRQQPDILVLNEVDRGWLLAGGHDLMRMLANELQLEYSFGPAADALWGNAILSRYPIEDVEVEILPGDAAMNRGYIAAQITVGDEQLGLIGTHLHHLEDGDRIRKAQAEQLAAAARALQTGGIPVLILGDLNAVPGSDPLSPLADFVDLVALAADGTPTPTFPSTDPLEQIDHVLGSPGITATELDIPTLTVSDHLPIAVTLNLANLQSPPPTEGG